MKSVLCLLHDGFEEIELVTPVDVLRRAGVTVTIAAMEEKSATGRNGITVMADAELAEVRAEEFDLLLIPGGPGVAGLRQDGRAAELARRFVGEGKSVAAICAAPLVLKDAGVLEGRGFTAFQSVRGELGEGLVDRRVVVDGPLITSSGAGTALDFALAITAYLCDEETAAAIAAEIMA